MANRYQKTSNAEFIETLKVRGLSYEGVTDGYGWSSARGPRSYWALGKKYIRKFEHPDVPLVAGGFRIYRILQKHGFHNELADIDFLTQGLVQLRSWIDAGDLCRCIDDTCGQVEDGGEGPKDHKPGDSALMHGIPTVSSRPSHSSYLVEIFLSVQINRLRLGLEI